MSWELLPTNYKTQTWDGNRKYRLITNADGTISLNDVTVYTNKEESFFGAIQANRMNDALNILMSMTENGTDLYEEFQKYFADQQELFANEWMTEFNAWFDHVKDQLSTDAAGNLQNQLDEISSKNINYIISATLEESSREGVMLVGNTSIVISDGLQILVEVKDDVKTSDIINFSGTWNLKLTDNTFSICSLNSSYLELDIEKGTFLYLIYSAERDCFVVQTQDNKNIAKTDVSNSFTQDQTFSSGKLIIGGSFVRSPNTQEMYMGSTASDANTLYLGKTENIFTVSPTYDQGLNLGAPNHKYSVVYAATGAISTSDRNAKEDIKPLDDEKTVAFVDALTPTSYKLKDGASGRRHYGFIAQDVEEAMKSVGISREDFAGFIASPKTEEYIEKNKDGKKVTKTREIEGEEIYGLRYEEFIPLLCKKVQILSKELEDIKKTLKKGKEK